MPNLDYSLLSVSALDSDGYNVIFSKGMCKVMRGERMCAQGKKIDGLYIMKNKSEKSSANLQTLLHITIAFIYGTED